ncbi:hypothetical protein GCM10009740_38420 [Terrabacter terrae]|uniref:Uncharacterized protein n=1 Tax=Terrabacter terrae TaxID=318434 RepID=A0ABN1ZPN2_9MICO
MLSAEISWRQEPGINRAYVWFSNGAIAGYRDLDTGHDYPTSPDYIQLMDHVLSDWLRTHGISCAGASSEPAPPELPSGRGLLAWFDRRRARRHHTGAVAAHREWRLDHPAWKVPVDPPQAGWRDLVRNDPGQLLWQRAAELPSARWFDLPQSGKPVPGPKAPMARRRSLLSSGGSPAQERGATSTQYLWEPKVRTSITSSWVQEASSP